MRFLVATALTQGMRGSDRFDATPGEMVGVPDLCARVVLGPDLRGRDAAPPDLPRPDPPRPDPLRPGSVRPGSAACPCARSFVGAASGGWVTTALVVETDLSRRELVSAMRAGAGAGAAVGGPGRPGPCAAHLTDHALAVAARWPVGTVLERDGALFLARVTRPWPGS